jgi:hypothetical protein
VDEDVFCDPVELVLLPVLLLVELSAFPVLFEVPEVVLLLLLCPFTNPCDVDNDERPEVPEVFIRTRLAAEPWSG